MMLVRMTMTAIALVIALLVTCRAEAMPNFSRALHVPCATCHDPVWPRLNDIGYRFRRAGYRMPENIGQDDADFDVNNQFSTSVTAQYILSATSDSEAPQQTTSTFQLAEVNVRPMNGPFLRRFAMGTHLSWAPGESPEIENAWLRVVVGRERFWFTARAGVFAPFEGFGASDQPIGVSRPLFETTGASWSQDTLYRFWGSARVGVDVGVQWRDTSLMVAVTNPIATVPSEDRTGVVGSGVTPTVWGPGARAPDILVVANQLLGARSGITAYYAYGTTQLPQNLPAFAAGTDPSTWNNDYHRVALFGSLGVWRLTMLLGALLGFDTTRQAVNPYTFNSAGGFFELEASLASFAVAFARFDYFKPGFNNTLPTMSDPRNDRVGGAAGVVLYQDWVSIIVEYQLVDALGAPSDVVNHTAVAQATAIY